MNVVFQKIRFALYFLNTKPQTKKDVYFFKQNWGYFFENKTGGKFNWQKS